MAATYCCSAEEFGGGEAMLREREREEKEKMKYDGSMFFFLPNSPLDGRPQLQSRKEGELVVRVDYPTPVFLPPHQRSKRLC